MPAGALTLFHVRGIRIGVDYSWFFVLFLIIILLSGFYQDVTGADEGSIGPYALALASALLFFGSILLHELGHAFVAIRNGIPIEGITLWMFGGVARMARDTDTPWTEFKVAIAGPIVTAVITVACIAAGVALSSPDEFRDAALIEEGTTASAVPALLGWLASINLLVLLFNLVPAFPLDGGRIARSIAWKVSGERGKATRFAATLGRGFAYLLIGLGAFLFIRGDIVGGLWLVVLGFILNGSARGAIAQTEVTDRLEGISVEDVMDREPVAIPEGASVDRAVDEYFLRYRWPWFPVVDAASRFVGLIDHRSLESVPEDERSTRTVGEYIARDPGSLSIREDAPLESLIGNEALSRLGALMAVDAQGQLRGVITSQALGRALDGPSAIP
jgi:Zn-dependent protease